MMACLWTRTLINVWVYFINVASFFGAIVDPLQCNVAAKLAANWFPLSQQVAANTIGAIASVLGGIIGGFYTLVYIDTTVTDVSEARHMLFYAMLYLAITYSAIYIISILIYKDKPDIPPWYFFIYAQFQQSSGFSRRKRSQVHQRTALYNDKEQEFPPIAFR
eukprot:TRINITY_DN586_c0_g1_i1.p6 TRINITY_DN586_c0_g1~~TRINITY_DN586_c0_g1_i1.p6  ORF type:complete len:163 (+),score=0.26 TRINITY_DN586_c0_g1_i1:524-1012(+)